MRAFLTVLCGFVLSTAAFAEDNSGNVTAADPASVVKALQDYGLAAKLGKSNSGAPMIDTKVEGLFSTVYFFDCDDQKANCQDISFEAIFSEKKDYPVDLANDWNYDNRFAMSYRNKDGSISLVMDVNLDKGGVSAAYFEDMLNWWDDSLVRFKKHIDY